MGTARSFVQSKIFSLLWIQTKNYFRQLFPGSILLPPVSGVDAADWSAADATVFSSEHVYSNGTVYTGVSSSPAPVRELRFSSVQFTCCERGPTVPRYGVVDWPIVVVVLSVSPGVLAIDPHRRQLIEPAAQSTTSFTYTVVLYKMPAPMLLLPVLPRCRPTPL